MIKNASQGAKEILAELEDIWKKYDHIYNAFSEEQWNKKYGKDWVFADQPYHLAFFDRMVADSLLQGEKPKQKNLYSTMAQINAWNEQEFQKRPKNYSPQQALDDFRKSHVAIRKAAGKIKSWDAAVWMPLFFGSVSAIAALEASLVHHVGEYIELCLRLGKDIDTFVESMKRRQQFMLTFMSLSVDKQEAAKRNFILEWNFTGPSASSWTIRVENGSGKLEGGRAKNPDLSMSMSLASFEKMVRKMKHPMLMMFTREIKVKGFSKMPTFMKLFPQP